jgi:hypothetical protein
MDARRHRPRPTAPRRPFCSRSSGLHPADRRPWPGLRPPPRSGCRQRPVPPLVDEAVQQIRSVIAQQTRPALAVSGGDGGEVAPHRPGPANTQAGPVFVGQGNVQDGRVTSATPVCRSRATGPPAAIRRYHIAGRQSRARSSSGPSAFRRSSCSCHGYRGCRPVPGGVTPPKNGGRPRPAPDEPGGRPDPRATPNRPPSDSRHGV